MKTNANYTLLLGKSCNSCYHVSCDPAITNKHCVACKAFSLYKPKEKQSENN